MLGVPGCCSEAAAAAAAAAAAGAGNKRLDFEDFSKIQQIINKDLHKTEKGLKEIILIKSEMNSKRNHEN